MASTVDHWDEIYSTRPTSDVSWFQREPYVSLRLIQQNSVATSSIIDVGAGASFLADRLMALNYVDVTLLDVSQAALNEVLVRIGDSAGRLKCVVGDVTDWRPSRRFDLWHDRAVFHFLTEPEPRARYVENATKAIRPGGTLILGVFAEDGPTHCSGLPVRRYSAEDLQKVFSESFTLKSHEREEHLTPTGAIQSFTWVALSRKEN